MPLDPAARDRHRADRQRHGRHRADLVGGVTYAVNATQPQLTWAHSDAGRADRRSAHQGVTASPGHRPDHRCRLARHRASGRQHRAHAQQFSLRRPGSTASSTRSGRGFLVASGSRHGGLPVTSPARPRRRRASPWSCRSGPIAALRSGPPARARRCCSCPDTPAARRTSRRCSTRSRRPGYARDRDRPARPVRVAGAGPVRRLPPGRAGRGRPRRRPHRSARRCTCSGHSFGGLVARAAVIAEPDAFASLVLLSSGPGRARRCAAGS